MFKNTNNLGIGKATIISEGSDISILAIGPIVSKAIKAAEALKDKSLSDAVTTMGGIKPIDNKFLKKMVSKGLKKWVSLEEHSIISGLGSTLLKWISENEINKKIDLYRLGIKDNFIHELGNQSFTRKKLGLDYEGIAYFLQNLC